MNPSQIGRYEIEAEIGRGGMATVYRAYDPHFRRQVALKLLPREFLHEQVFRARFEREARTVAALEHTAIVPVYDFGEENNQPYLVMRLMAGGSLAERLKNGPLSMKEAVSIVERIGLALDEAHARGIVHRDLKPGNILFDQQGDAYLTDFGIVKLAEASVSYTGSGIIGTPAYMSPEQAHGNTNLDGRSDLYALGIVLYEMLVGKPPYQADTPIRIVMRHILEPIPDIRVDVPDLPPGIENIIVRILAKDPNDRYASSSELITDLHGLVGSKPGFQAPPARIASGELPAPKEISSVDLSEEVIGLRKGKSIWRFSPMAWIGIVAVCLTVGVGGMLLANRVDTLFVAATPTITASPSGIPTITEVAPVIGAPTIFKSVIPTLTLTATQTPRKWQPTFTFTPTITPSPTLTSTPTQNLVVTITGTITEGTEATSVTPNWVPCVSVGVTVSCSGAALCETNSHAWTCTGTVGSCSQPGSVDTCVEQCVTVFGSPLYRAFCANYLNGAACFCAVTGSY